MIPELETIKARAEAATGDKWSIEYGNCGCSADAGCCKPGEVWPRVIHGITNAFPPTANSEWSNAISEVAEMSPADAEFIASARSDVPRLVAAIEAVLAVENEMTDCDCEHCVGYNVALIEVREAIERALKEEQ